VVERSRQIYLDYAATTPVDTAVAAEMIACLSVGGNYANPSSDHDVGLEAAAKVERAREQLAALLGANAKEITFTSGATEAINMAMKGALAAYGGGSGHLITSNIEHKAVLAVADWLESLGVEVSRLMSDKSGVVSVRQVSDALRDDTILVSLQWVNNEIGSIQPIAEIAELLKTHTARFHVDGAQAVGKIPVSVGGIDYLSLSAHKFYGPKGVGALYCSAKPRARVTPVIHGAGQESGMRSGTIPVHQVAAMGAAAEIAAQRLDADQRHIRKLNRQLCDGLIELPKVTINAAAANRVCNIVSASFEGVNGKALRLALRDLYLSSGSACSSASAEPSFVLKALGLTDSLAEASLRFSLGRETTRQDLEYALARTHYEVKRLRDIAGWAAR
jgi:cysteine desulfurase